MASNLTLHRALYRRYPQPVASNGTPVSEVGDWLAVELAGLIGKVTEGLEPHDVGAHLTCSTILDLAFSGRGLDWQRIRSGIAGHTPFVPQTMVNAYECACWGYSLRYLAQRARSAPYVIVNIVDLNVFNLTWWLENENWGQSGFGIASLLFELGDAPESAVMVGASRTSTHIAEFTMDLRKTSRRLPGLPVALPFFPSHVTRTLERMLPGVTRLTDLHPRVGHCFGADPWLGIIDDVMQHGARDTRYLASSVALNGYWAIADVSTRSDGCYRFEEAYQ